MGQFAARDCHCIIIHNLEIHILILTDFCFCIWLFCNLFCFVIIFCNCIISVVFCSYGTHSQLLILIYLLTLLIVNLNSS